MKPRWECRYSSSEMMYLEIQKHEVVLYLDHSPSKADRYTFDEVLNGALDREVGAVFGITTLNELKTELKNRTDQTST